MSEKKIRLETLVELARREATAPIDVAGPVAARLASAAATSDPVDWSLWSVAGLSVAAAAAVVLISLDHEVLWQDPLVEWFRPLMMVMQ
ncbi:MAG: hypothetical protein ACYC6Y_15915 [Thermoguttaceae bacterium]